MTRSLSPVPATLSLADVSRLRSVQERLRHALRCADTLPGLRTYVAALACDIDEVLDPGLRVAVHVVGAAVQAEVDAAADTERTPASAAPWDDDCAPSTPRESELGEEYGV